MPTTIHLDTKEITALKQIIEATLTKTKTTQNTVVYKNDDLTFYLPNKFLSGDAPEKIILSVKAGE